MGRDTSTNREADMIASISSSTQTQSTMAIGGAGRSGARPGGGGDPLSSVADLLGTTSDELIEQLRNGSSLSDLATKAGVSRDDLLGAIREGLPPAPEGVTDVDVTSLVEGIADRAGLPGPARTERPSGPPPTREGSMAQLEGVADLFGMEIEDLIDQLESGTTSLADLASQQGVSTDQVFQALSSGMFADVRV
jgi:lambda repressor-like predicted transcriptional regulator